MKRIVIALLVGVVCCGSAVAQDAKKRIVFVAGKPSHGFAQHEHNAGCRLLAKAINESGLPAEAVVFENGWPKDEHAFDGAAAVIMYSDGGNGHMVMPNLKQVDALSDKGVGVGCIHYAVEPGDGKKQPDGRAEFLKWIGGYFETFYSINPHWRATFAELPKHPVTSGVKPFWTNDEWYYHMRFRPDMEGVTPILTAVPPDSTRKGKDDAHGGNAEIRAGLGKNLAEHVVWVSENKNGSRGFGCTGGHFHLNWWKDDFRKTILNAIVWTAKLDVPADGVKSTRPSAEDYLSQDNKPKPVKFSLDEIKQQIEDMNKPLEAKADAK
jgi:type 1 glutamine amidotransferase